MSPLTPTPNGRPLTTRPQPKIAPKEPETRQDAAKEAFLDVIFNAKSMGLELVDDFRASDRFFKYKAAVLVAWVLLTAVALYVSYPRFSSEPSNSLDARILVKQVPALDKQLTALYIENRSGKDWGDTLLKLNNTYTHALADLKVDAKAVVTINKFSGPDGATPPADLKPQKLEITCQQGHAEVDLNALQNQKVTTLVLLADTHGYHQGPPVPDGDILVHAGDLTRSGSLDELAEANRWLASLPHRHKLAIAGNHDFCFEVHPREARSALNAARYLQDEEAVVEGLRFWGSPWQPWFHDWAFNLPRGPRLAARWALVPEGLDVLVTHCPPARVLDETDGESVGCEDLLERVLRVRPRLNVFGHIHEARGALWKQGVLFVNAATDEGQLPAQVLDWPPREPRLPH